MLDGNRTPIGTGGEEERGVGGEEGRGPERLLQALQEAGEEVDGYGADEQLEEMDRGGGGLDELRLQGKEAGLDGPDVGEGHGGESPENEADLDRGDFGVVENGGEEGFVGLDSGEVENETAEGEEKDG